MTVVSDVKCSVVLGLREERSPECCLLFAVAPSISLTLPPHPADQPSQVGLGYLWKHEVCPCGVKGISAAPCWFYRGILWNDMDFYCCHRSKHVSFHQLLPGSWLMIYKNHLGTSESQHRQTPQRQHHFKDGSSGDDGESTDRRLVSLMFFFFFLNHCC